MKRLPNIHPGEVLLHEFLDPMGISQNALARAAGVPPRRINEIVLGKRGVTADSAVRLARVLGTSDRFWLGLQADFVQRLRQLLADTLDVQLALQALLVQAFGDGAVHVGLQKAK